MSIHVVLVTYRRPLMLMTRLEEFAERGDLASMVVVDNGGGPRPDGLDPGIDWVSMSQNAGPAGGRHRGVSSVADRLVPEDLVLFQDDDDAFASAETLAALADFSDAMLRSGRALGCTGLAGARLSRSGHRLTRPQDDELSGPVSVDYVGGGHCMLVPAVALLAGLNWDPQLFYGFEELDFGLRARSMGFEVLVPGSLWLEQRRAKNRTGGAVPRMDRDRSRSSRYFAARNFPVVVGRWRGLGAALLAAAFVGGGQLLSDVIARRWSLLWPTVQGLTDAARARMGQVATGEAS